MDRKMKARLANTQAKIRKERKERSRSSVNELESPVCLEIGQRVEIEGCEYKIVRSEEFDKSKLN